MTATLPTGNGPRATGSEPPDAQLPGTEPRSRGLRGAIARHPLTAFFLMAFGLSWLAWTPYVLSGSGLGILDFDFPILLGTTQLTGVLPGAYLGPIVSALVITRIAYGRAGVSAWFGRFKRWRVRWVWYLGVITGVPLALTLAGLLLSGGHPQPPAVTLLVVYLPMLLLQVITTGLAEEPGWRDFALPLLQPRYGALGGSLVLGPLWGCWHLPLFLTSWGNWPDVNLLDVITFILTAMSICVAMTWVFNRTGQSLPLQMILHASINTYATIVWGSIFPGMDHAMVSRGILLTFASAAVILVVVTRGRLGSDGPAFVRRRVRTTSSTGQLPPAA